jgi:uncharacterized protein YaaQ
MNEDTEPKKVDLMMMAIVQAQDAQNAEEALCTKGISVTRLPSVGGFLGQRNATLLIGLARKDMNTVLEALRTVCRERTEYIAVPLESAPLPMPTPTPITVGGAIVFTFPVEHYEEV